MSGPHRLRALLAAWAAFAESLQDGYEFGLDDYLNDLDVRRLIAETLHGSENRRLPAIRRRIATLDDRVRGATLPTDTCLWGSNNASKHGWTPEGEWWYYAVPREPSREFEEDLLHLS